MPTNTGFTGLTDPGYLRDIPAIVRWLGTIYHVVNRMLVGGLNVGGSFTCDAADTTTITDSRVSGASRIVIWPTNEEAAILVQTTQVYTSSKANGSFVVTHAAGANGTETFDYIAIG